MIRILQKIIIAVFLLSSCSSGGQQGRDENSDMQLNSDLRVRPPAVSGKFYPSNPDKLQLAVEKYLEDAREVDVLDPQVIIVPHAGYAYSAQIAADAFRQVSTQEYDLVFILGTNHTTAGFNGISVSPDGSYETPLGKCLVDKNAVNRLIESNENICSNPAVHGREHSVEVEIPFVQVLFPDAKIVPLVLGTAELSTCTELGKTIVRLFSDRKMLIIASSDLTHYPAQADAVTVDHAVLKAIETLQPDRVKDEIREQMKRGVRQLSTCACGEGPILAAISAARELGMTRAQTVSYANSGDAIIGDADRVVGYGAVVFDRGIRIRPDPVLQKPNTAVLSRPIADRNRQALLKVARTVIERYLTTETFPLIRDLPAELSEKSGAFVTLNKHGALRGCIGHMANDMPLDKVVARMALQAAFQDNRFRPVSLEELGEIEIEISVLTPYKSVAGYDAIQLGRDGIVLRKNGRSAVFLPQVASEQGWDLETTLTHLSTKAGLSPDSWRSGAQFQTFQAEVFHEEEH